MRHQRDRDEDGNNELVISQPQPGTRCRRFRGEWAGRGVGRDQVVDYADNLHYVKLR